jgi:Rod binding domain-containing protein
MLGATNEITLGASSPRALPDALTGRQDDFASVIARARKQIEDSPSSREAAAKESAREFVAVTLVQPLLKQLRDTSQAAAPFAPSGAERQFRSMLDAQMAQRIVRASNFGIVDAVARNLMRAGSEKGSTP